MATAPSKGRNFAVLPRQFSDVPVWMKCSWSGKINQYAINHRLDWLAPNPPRFDPLSISQCLFIGRWLWKIKIYLVTTLLFIWLSVILCLFLYKHINPWQFKSFPCNSLNLQYFLTVLNVKSTQVAYRRLGQYLLTHVGKTMLMQSDWNQPPSIVVRGPDYDRRGGAGCNQTDVDAMSAGIVVLCRL